MLYDTGVIYIEVVELCMFEVGQLVRIREQTWQVLEDHAAYAGGDHALRVRGLEGRARGQERLLVVAHLSRMAWSLL